MARVRHWKAYLLGLVMLVAIVAFVSTKHEPLRILPPQVDECIPLGVQRGVVSELTAQGSALVGNPRLVAPFKFVVVTPAPSGSDANRFKTRFTIAPDTPLGIYPVRVLTEEGLSDPFPLVVGQLPQTQEREPNNDVDKQAQRITIPTVIEALLPEGDYDDYRFRAKKGQRIMAELQCARIGSGTDANLLLGSLDRKFLAATNFVSGDPADTPLFATLPGDDEYWCAVLKANYRPIKSGRRVYRLTLGALPAAAEVYPLGGRRGETIRVKLRGGTLDGTTVVPVTLTPADGESIVRLRVPTTVRGPDGASLDVESLPPLVLGDFPEVLEPDALDTPQPKVTSPVVLNGRIDPSDDVDTFTLAVTPGQRLRVSAASIALGSALRPKLTVRNSQGRELVTSSQTVTVPSVGEMPQYTTFDPSVEFLVPEGQNEVTLAVHGTWMDELSLRGGTGHAYRVTVVPVKPSFSVELNDAQVNVPKGGVAAVGVTVSRDGYDGPINLRVANPHAGLSFRPGTVAAGQTVGSFSIAAADDATFGPLLLDVIGEGQETEEPLLVHASKVVVFGEPVTEPFRREDDWDTPAHLRTRVQTQPGLFATTTSAAPITFNAPAGPIELAQGSGTTFKVKLIRPKGAEGALTLKPLPLPPGLVIPDAKVDATETETEIKVKVDRDHPPGPVTVVLTARGRIAGAERWLAIPAVTLQIAQPTVSNPLGPAKSKVP